MVGLQCDVFESDMFKKIFFDASGGKFDILKFSYLRPKLWDVPSLNTRFRSVPNLNTQFCMLRGIESTCLSCSEFEHQMLLLFLNAVHLFWMTQPFNYSFIDSVVPKINHCLYLDYLPEALQLNDILIDYFK